LKKGVGCAFHFLGGIKNLIIKTELAIYQKGVGFAFPFLGGLQISKSNNNADALLLGFFHSKKSSNTFEIQKGSGCALPFFLN
jgi:hypothetical protein